MTIKIDTNIPIPNGRGQESELKDALKRLKVAHSFVWPTQHSPYNAARRLGIEITTRKEENGTGYRVWRTK